MRLPRRTLVVFIGVTLGLSFAHSAQAVLANRVFVSQRSGNDSNGCNNILTPCLTFAGAIAQLNPGGEAIVLDSGGYGAVTITQSVTIEAPAGVLAFIHPPSGGDAITVNASGASVVLRGITIDGAGAATGNGIKVVAVSVLHVESCVISGFAGNSPSGNGIYFQSAGQLFVKDTIVRGNGFIGIWVTPASATAHASVDHCRLEKNEFGLSVDGEAGGVPHVTIRNSVASGNTQDGLETQAGGELNVEECLVANNAYGIESIQAGSVARVSNCTVTDNTTYGLIAGGGGSLLSRSNNTMGGNGTDTSGTTTFSAQ